MENNEVKSKQYIIKNIPPDVWRNFKIRLMQGGMNTYNEWLLKLINRYTQGEISV